MLPALGFYYYHNSKTFSSKRRIISDLILDEILSHSPKAPSSIFVTLFGILMLVSDLHPPKASIPIVVTLFGILMQVSDLQHQKALFPMFVTQTGIFMLMRTLKMPLRMSLA